MNHDKFDLGKSFNHLLNYGNSRMLELRQPNGQALFRLPLTVAVLVGVVALVAQLIVPLAIAVGVLLVLKFKFVLVRGAVKSESAPSAETQAKEPENSL